MIIYPAIDLKQGNCVRLYKGDMNQATIFNDNPASQAKYFEDQGFEFLHIVDLDGAIDGRPVNEDAVKSIIKNVSIPTQLGGGIRDLETIQKWLNLGLSRVIIGTAALNNPELVKQAAKQFPKQIVVGIDARNGMVATHGWVEESNVSAIELGKRFEDAGVAAIVYTDINRDGAMQGVDVNGTKNLAENLSIPVIASGGVSSIEDIKNLKKIEKCGVQGAIVGRALYDKKIDVLEMLNLAKHP